MKNLIAAVAILMASLFSVTISAQETTLTTFEDVMHELTTGKLVRGVFFYKDMMLKVDGEVVEGVPEAIGGMTIDTFEYFAKGSIGNEEAYLAASESVLINHPSYGVVYNYAKLRIYESGKVELLVQYLDPNSFDVEMDETFYGEIGAGVKFFRH